MRIPPGVRTQHIYIAGMTQYGKSTLIHHLALHDINQGYGVCIMDGKGDFIPRFIDYIPKHRVNDTIYLDVLMPVPLDFIGYHGEREQEKLVAEIKYLLTRTVETQHIPILSRNIEHILLTLFNYNEHPQTPDSCRATFLDIANFIEDPARQKEILSRVSNERLQRRWHNDPLNRQDAARVLTRIDPFLSSPTLTKIFGGKKPKFNIAQAIREHKVLLVNLALGGIDEIQRMYGTLLLAKIRQSMLRQADIPDKSKLTRFYLYCDEFQEYQTSDFPKMLSQAGGLGLCLTLAHQYVDQLDRAILHGIKGNVSSYICFRLGEESANAIKSVFPKGPDDRYGEYRRTLEEKVKKLQIERELLIKNRKEPYKEYPDPERWDDPLSLLNNAILTTQRDVDHLPNPSRSADPALLPFLHRGEILYRAADGMAHLLHTPKPPGPPNASYAEIIRKRTIDEYSCDDMLQVCSTEGDGSMHDKSENINAGRSPNVPPHHGKKKDS